METQTQIQAGQTLTLCEADRQADRLDNARNYAELLQYLAIIHTDSQGRF